MRGFDYHIFRWTGESGAGGGGGGWGVEILGEGALSPCGIVSFLFWIDFSRVQGGELTLLGFTSVNHGGEGMILGLTNVDPSPSPCLSLEPLFRV
jgi:hypothetical protein